MRTKNMTSRRTILKTGLSTIAAASLPGYTAFASPKAPGETRVLILGGDYYHNPIAIENHWREVLHSTGWRLMFAQSAQFITPDALRYTDLFILVRGTDPDDLGFSPDGIVEDRSAPAAFMTTVQEDAIIENINRGMGFLAMHSSTRFGNNVRYLNHIGVAKSNNHGQLQQVRLHTFNQDHPITQGLTRDIRVGLDQTLESPLTDDVDTVLFYESGAVDTGNMKSGWCIQRGDGRIVALMPGHLPEPRNNGQYKQIMFRAAHWALKRDIPEISFGYGQPFRWRGAPTPVIGHQEL